MDPVIAAILALLSAPGDWATVPPEPMRAREVCAVAQPVCVQHAGARAAVTYRGLAVAIVDGQPADRVWTQARARADQSGIGALSDEGDATRDREVMRAEFLRRFGQ